ncbi:MAG TPA: hypothetical protein VHU14_06605 [Solirubrobacterales bacterium]|jgi:hypothetical protein|nr:hypothetical protein [Solirubrobacterales bacterium]
MAAGREPPGDLPALAGGIVEAVEAARSDAVSAECEKLLATLRARCPDLILDRRLSAGQVGPEVPLDEERGPSLYRLVARQVAGLPTEGAKDPGVVVWARGDDELAVLVDEVKVTTAEGAIEIAIPVRCDQVGGATVRVRFAVGSEARPGGMVASTDQRPLGPHEVVDVWGEALTAFAWQIVLSTAARLADATGRDADGAGLIPAALQASARGIAVLTMARHSFDRPAGA